MIIERLRSAGDQLRAAWDNYTHVVSTLKDSCNYGSALHAYDGPSELSKHLTTELTFISSYTSKIDQVKVAISQIHNYSSGMAPINTLPPEILTRIFHLARPRPCRFHNVSIDDEVNYVQYYGYPDYLSQVCSLWRTTALASRSLWCHIDLSPGELWFDALAAQADRYAARGGDLPIELHIAEAKDWRPRVDDTSSNYEDLYHLLSRISSRIESLEMFVSGDLEDFYRDMLSILLCRSQLGLKRLGVRSGSSHHDTFISPEFFELGHLILVPSEMQVERAFAKLTVLHLRGIFPLWSSTAYHGLVDLRLLSADGWSHIASAELVTILGSSPGLRILHFGLQIVDADSINEQVTPVYLQDLQLVKIFTFNGANTDECPSTLLRLLAPGKLPLSLILHDCHDVSYDVVMELDRFFARSRVARFYTRAITPPLNLFRRHSAHLEWVVLDGLDFDYSLELHANLPKFDDPAPTGILKSLHIIESGLLESELCGFLEWCPTGIILESCRIYHDPPDDDTECTELNEDEVPVAFPTVRIHRDKSRDPVADWDILD